MEGEEWLWLKLDSDLQSGDKGGLALPPPIVRVRMLWGDD